jgi:hypothetical protein
VLSVTLDSSTYVSALNFSDAVLEEFAGVLRDKFRWSGIGAHYRQRHVGGKDRISCCASSMNEDWILDCAAVFRLEDGANGREFQSQGNDPGTEELGSGEHWEMAPPPQLECQGDERMNVAKRAKAGQNNAQCAASAV